MQIALTRIDMVGILDNDCHHNRDSRLGFNTIKIGIEMRPYLNNTIKTHESTFKTVSEEEIQRINRLQSELFDQLHNLFEPPLPEGVPERLEEIVFHGNITEGDTVLDVGSGTGILIPIIKKYKPSRIYACDLSEDMLEQLRENYPYVKTILADVRDLSLPDQCIDEVFINACYPNIVDKIGAFSNVSRMMKAKGRLVISHPLGKAFISSLKGSMPFTLDDFPEKPEASALFKPFGFKIETVIDEPELYILVASKHRGTR